MHGGVALQHLGLGLCLGSIRVRVYVGHLWIGEGWEIGIVSELTSFFEFRVRLGLRLRLVFRVRV